MSYGPSPFMRPSRCLRALWVFVPCDSSGALCAVCTPCRSLRHPFYGSGLAVVGAPRLPFLPLLVFLLPLVFAMRLAGLDACGRVHCLPLLPSVGCRCLQSRLLQVAVACPSHVGVRPVLPSVRRVFTPCSSCGFSRVSRVLHAFFCVSRKSFTPFARLVGLSHTLWSFVRLVSACWSSVSFSPLAVVCKGREKGGREKSEKEGRNK